MGEKSQIDWTDATWNPITGCSPASDGCRNCYAARLAGTRLKHHSSREGLTRQAEDGRYVFNGSVVLNEDWLTQPLRWKRPRLIFVCAHGDLFHENVPDAWIDRVFAVMTLAQHHTYQILTKRPGRMRKYFNYGLRHQNIGAQADRLADEDTGLPKPPYPHIWLGTTVEDQEAADTRIPELLQTPAAVRFISAEPLLGPVDLMQVDVARWLRTLRPDGPQEPHPYDPDLRQPLLVPGYHAPSGASWPGLDWVIAGGESGPGARPMHPGWARDLRDQCEDAGVPFFMKQMTEKAAIPDDLMVREMPYAAR